MRTKEKRVSKEKNRSKNRKKDITRTPKTRKEFLKQQENLISYIKKDAESKGETVRIYEYDPFEKSLHRYYTTAIIIRDENRGWEEEKTIKTSVSGDRTDYRNEDKWKYKHKLSIKVKNPHIYRGGFKKTKSFKTFASFKKFYHEFTYIDV